MKNQLIILFASVFFMPACNKDSVTLSNTIFINTTAHQVNVTGYKDGLIQTESSFILSPNETKSVFMLNNRGIGNGLTFGAYYRYIDSFVVKFDNLYSIAHYKPALAGSNIKSYPFASGRNIFNEVNYISNLVKDEKYRREWDFKYTFIEQDYTDAK